MFKRTKVCSGVLVALGGSLMLGAVPVLAQQAPATAASAATDRVEITGSRIKSISTDSASPIVTLTAESIAIDGVSSAEDLMNSLPQVFAGYGAQVSNGSTGTATLDLRGLGPSRTLVLLNGRRLPAGDPGFVPPDINQIPVPLIKRVDVLTGGASAVYGSDAISGVVNFIMDDHFQGVKVSVNRGIYNHKQHDPAGVDAANNAKGFALPGNVGGDGGTTDLSITMGSNFADNKGNATVFFGYKKTAAVLEAARDYSACTLGVSGSPGSSFSCGGSSTSFPGRFLGANGSYTFDSAGNPVKYSSAKNSFNYGPLNYFQRPDERYTAAAFAHYDISDMARVYSEFNFMDDFSVAQIAPSGLFFGNPYTVSVNNPLITPAMKTALGLDPVTQPTETIYIGRRNVEGGDRQDNLRHTSFRAVAGVKGDVGAWSYDASAQVGKVIYQEEYLNDVSVVKAQRALNVVSVNGVPTCQSVVDGSDPNCVPYNIWQPGGVTSAATNYLNTPGFKNGYTSQLVYSLNGSVDLGAYGVKIPGTSSGANLAFGLENRQESLSLNTDQEFSSGDLAGQGGPTIGQSGGYSVRDIFGEFKLPLLEKLPGAELLSLDAAYRNSKYSTNNTTNTYSLGLDWVVAKGYQVRGSVQRAARAPNIIELDAVQSIGLTNLSSDPCMSHTDANGNLIPPTATLQQCQATGMTAAQYGENLDNSAGQYNALFGGNPNLKPETSDSYTFGLVLQPLKDLSLTLDYFSFKVRNEISNAPPSTILSQCIATQNPTYCALIHRSANGTLWTGNSYIQATNANLAEFTTSGVDLGADYSLKIAGAGRVDMSLLGTFLDKYTLQPLPGNPSYDCAGYFGNTCGTPNPKWRHTARVTWVSPYNFRLSGTWRYFASVKDEGTSSDPQLNGSLISPNGKFPSMSYFDLSAAYDVTKSITARLGFRNLFDKDPPLAVTGAPFGNGNTYPQVYDSLGRQINLNLTATF